MAYACARWYEDGCGLFFCEEHHHYSTYPLKQENSKTSLCKRCAEGKEPFEQKPDHIEWVRFMLKDKSWKEWRDAHPEKVKEMKERVNSLKK